MIKSAPQWVFWPLVGVVAFSIGDLLIQAFGDRRFLATQAAIAGLVVAIPLSVYYSCVGFQKTVTGLASVLWDTEENCLVWLEPRLRRVFTLVSWPSKLVTAAVVLLGLLTINVLGVPFASRLLNVLAVLSFSIVLAMCGQAAYVCLGLAFSLIELTGRAPKLPFFLLPYPALQRMSTYYLGVVLAVVIGYILVFVAVFGGPYGMQPLLAIWLSVLAFYPLGLFCLWLFRLHVLNERIKFSFAKRINDEVQKALSTVEKSESAEMAERLEKLMAVQTSISRTRAWPLDVQSSVTLLVALLTAMGQVLLLVSQIFRS